MKSLSFVHALKASVFIMGMMLCMSIPFMCSCGDNDEGSGDIPVSSVTLSATSLTLSVGETAQLTATLQPEDATVQTVTWTSSDEAIVTVTADGWVAAISSGNATVTAKAGGKSADCAVVVKSDVAPDEPIVIEGEAASLNLDAFADVQDAVNAISEADKAGVKEYTLFGDFAKLGIGTDMNPFKESNAEIIDMSNVTGWPDVPTDIPLRSAALKGIPENAFGRGAMDAESPLNKIILPKSVEIISKKAFSNCTNLATVVMPGVLIVEEESFSGCFSLSSVDAPLLQVIGTSAFADCDAWERVYLPSVRIVGEDAFYGCDKKTKEVDLPEAVTLCEDAFKDCLFLEKVNLPKVEVVGYQAFAYNFCEKPVELVLPSATTIAKNGFYDCEKLYRLSLPKAKTIGDYAFHNCYELTTLELTASDAIQTSEDTFGDFDPSACNLVLNANKKDEANGNTWKGVTWKSITFE